MKGPQRPKIARGKRLRRAAEETEKARKEAPELLKMIGENTVKAM